MLDYLKLLLTFQAVTPVCLTTYKGATFQALFKTALFRVSCHHDQKTCTGVKCPDASNCPFFTIAEHRTVANENTVLPYVIGCAHNHSDFLSPGERITFNLTLFGKAIDYLGHVVAALSYWQHLGIGRSPFLVTDAVLARFGMPSHWDASIMPTGRLRLAAVQAYTDSGLVSISTGGKDFRPPPRQSLAWPATNESGTHNVVVTFLSPLRLESSGLITARRLTASIFLRLLAERLRKLFDTWGCRAEEKQTIDIVDNADVALLSQLVDAHVKRYKFPFKKYVMYDGIIGHLVLEQIPADLLPYLTAGQIVHVGKFTAMGNGQCTMEVFA